MAPGLPNIAEHFGITSETITAMTLSIFLLTFAIGPLFLAPLSEIYGRTWVGSILARNISSERGLCNRCSTLAICCSWLSTLHVHLRQTLVL